MHRAAQQTSAASASRGNWLPGRHDTGKVNVALHAQSKYSFHGFVAGSEITTRGIAAAFKSASDIGVVRVFAPFDYAEVGDVRSGRCHVEGAVTSQASCCRGCVTIAPCSAPSVLSLPTMLHTHTDICNSQHTYTPFTRAHTHSHTLLAPECTISGSAGPSVCSPPSAVACCGVRVRWDLVIVEGWYGRVPHFIASIRLRNPFVVVVYVCLDTWPSPLRFLRVDADAFVTNSRVMQGVLSSLAPTQFMHLAVDPAEMRRTAGKPEYR